MIFRVSEHAHIKKLSEGRIGIILLQNDEPMFIVDGLMAEIFQDLGKVQIKPDEVIPHWCNKFEDSEHEILKEHMKVFFQNLIEKGILVPHEE